MDIHQLIYMLKYLAEHVGHQEASDLRYLLVDLAEGSPIEIDVDELIDALREADL